MNNVHAYKCNVGLDVHKKFIYCVAMDDKGEVLFEKKVSNEPHELDKFIKIITKDSNIALESCSCWEYVYDYLDEAGFTNINLANPSRIGLIATSKKKTDKHDAFVLANLVRTNMLPTSYAPSHIVREQRRITRYRASLGRLQAEVKNKIHAILIRHGIQNPFENMFTEAGFAYLHSLDLDWTERTQVDDYIGLIRHMRDKAKNAEKLIEEYAMQNPLAKLLITIPGISTYSAISILGEMGEIRRFKNAKKLTSFAGLNPSVYQSADKCNTGHISKKGNKHLRWMLGQCANIAIMHDSQLAKIYHRIKKRRGHNIAITATARKMLTFILQMLDHGLTYQQLRINKEAS
jgi:transposase